MEESTSAKAKEVNKIQTFVFLDLESTGLKDTPRIVELSMIAVSRMDLLAMGRPTLPSTCQDISGCDTTNISDTDTTEALQKNAIPNLPRVLHKYTRLYYPWKVMTPSLEEINGLNNEMLEHLPGFSEASAEALNLFLDFPKPVSLVSHNGNRFDFPLLKAELNNVNSLDKFLNLQCTDTLLAIKDIDALIEKEDIIEITRLAEFFVINDLDDDLMVEDFPLNKRVRSEEPDVERGSQAFHESSQAVRGNQQLLEVCAEPLMTPVKSCLPGQTSTPDTPSRPSHPPPLPVTPEGPQPSTPGTPGFCSKAIKDSSKVRRTLTYEGRGKRKYNGKMPYRQSNIYRRLFDSGYSAHRAESDSEALLEICGHYGSRFVEWADTFATEFTSVKPMWVKRKSFSTKLN